MLFKLIRLTRKIRTWLSGNKPWEERFKLFRLEGHLDAMAVRKMIKLFLASLWLVWREAEGLPITQPYAIEKKGHTGVISPWEMVDREAKGLE